MNETHTITATPEQWRFVNAYRAHGWGDYKPRYSVVLTDASLLPEEIANEVATSTRDGSVYLSGYRAPVVEHHQGWEHLEQELRRMEATNRSPDGLFEGCTLEITFQAWSKEPRRDSRYTAPLLILSPTKIAIVESAS